MKNNKHLLEDNYNLDDFSTDESSVGYYKETSIDMEEDNSDENIRKQQKKPLLIKKRKPSDNLLSLSNMKINEDDSQDYEEMSRSINEDSDDSVPDRDIFDENIREYLTGKLQIPKIEHYVTAKFVKNLDLVMRVFFGCLICSILIFIPWIQTRIVAVDFAVVIATLSFGRNFGENVRSIFTFVGIVIALALVVVYSIYVPPANKIAHGFFLFFTVFIISFSRYSIISQKYFILVFSLVLMVWINAVETSTFVTMFAVKLGFSCAIGFAVVFVVSLFPFPLFARKLILKELTVATRCIELLTRMLAAKFETNHFGRGITQVAEMRILSKICEEKLDYVSSLFDSISIEAPFSLHDGYINYTAFLRSLLKYCKGMSIASEEFSIDGHVYQLRNSIGNATSTLAIQATSSLSDIFTNFNNQKKKKELQSAIEGLHLAFSQEKKKIASKGFLSQTRNLIDFKISHEKTPDFSPIKNQNNLHPNSMDQGSLSNVHLFSKLVSSEEEMEHRKMKELTATYFFLFELLRFGETIRDYYPQKFLTTSCSNIGQGIRSIFVDAWSLKSPSHPTVLQYLKSSEFLDRISYSFMYSVAVTIACLPILITPLKNIFNDPFPYGIAGTVIFVFAGSTGSSFHLAKVRIGGTLIGNLFTFIVLKFSFSSPYSITAFGTGFVTLMALISTDYGEIAGVATYVGISSLYTRINNNKNLEVYIVTSLLETFVGGVVILFVYSFKWWTTSAQLLLRQRYKESMSLLRTSIIHCAFVVDNVGGEKAEIMFDHHSIFPSIDKIKQNLVIQNSLLNDIQEEPNIFRPRVRVEENHIIFTELMNISDYIMWCAHAAKILSEEKDCCGKLFPSIRNVVYSLVNDLKSCLLESEKAILQLDDSGLDRKFMGKTKEIFANINTLEENSMKTLVTILRDRSDNKMDNKVLSSFLSFVFTFSKIANSVDNLWETIFRWKVTYYLDISHF